MVDCHGAAGPLQPPADSERESVGAARGPWGMPSTDRLADAHDRALARIAELETELVDTRLELAAVRLEAEQWKRRSYPTPGEIQARLTIEKVEAWLDRNLVRVKADPSDRWAQRWPTWRDDVSGLDYPAEWRVDDVDLAMRRIANLIESIADGRNLDQWALLDAMAAMVTEQQQQGATA